MRNGERRNAYADHMDRPRGKRQIGAGAGDHGPGTGEPSPDHAGTGAHVPRGGAGSVPRLRPHRQPQCRGADLPEPCHPRAERDRWSGGGDAGQRRQAADHAAVLTGAAQQPEGVRAALPAGGVPAPADHAGGRILRLSDRAGDAVPPCGGHGGRHGRQAAGCGADLCRL